MTSSPEKNNLKSFLKTPTGGFSLSEILMDLSYFIYVYWIFFLGIFPLTDSEIVIIMLIGSVLPIFSIFIYDQWERHRLSKNLGFWAGIFSIFLTISFVILLIGIVLKSLILVILGMFASWSLRQFLSLEFNSIILKLSRKTKNVHYSYTKLQQFIEFGYAFGILLAGIVTFFWGMPLAVVVAIIFQTSFTVRMFLLEKKYRIPDMKTKTKLISLKHLKSKFKPSMLWAFGFLAVGMVMVLAEDVFSSYELDKFEIGELMFGVQNISVMILSIIILHVMQKKVSLENGFMFGIISTILMYFSLTSLGSNFLFIIPATIFTSFTSVIYSNAIPIIDKYANTSEKNSVMIYEIMSVITQFLTYVLTFWVYTSFGQMIFLGEIIFYALIAWYFLNKMKNVKINNATNC